jgi:hypothetical protein
MSYFVKFEDNQSNRSYIKDILKLDPSTVINTVYISAQDINKNSGHEHVLLVNLNGGTNVWVKRLVSSVADTEPSAATTLSSVLETTFQVGDKVTFKSDLNSQAYFKKAFPNCQKNVFEVTKVVEYSTADNVVYLDINPTIGVFAHRLELVSNKTDNTEFSLNWPHGYITRNGLDAEILKTNFKSSLSSESCILALVTDKSGNQNTLYLRSTGKLYSNAKSNFDILNKPAPKKHLTGWVAVLKSGYVSAIQTSEGNALKYFGEDANLFALLKVDIEEGTGLS